MASRTLCGWAFLSVGCSFDPHALGDEDAGDSVGIVGATSHGAASSGVTSTAASGDETDSGTPEEHPEEGTTGAALVYRRWLAFTEETRVLAQQDVPILVRLDPDRIEYEHTQAQGNDLRFYDASGEHRLPHEIEVWNPGGASFVWVRVPEIGPSDAGSGLWMHYGNHLDDAVDGGAAQEVWAEPYIGVWHFGAPCVSAQSQQQDATGRGHDGRCVALSADSTTTGVVGNALVFGKGNAHVLVDDAPALTPGRGFTLEYWLRLDAHPTDQMRAAVQKYGSYVFYALRSNIIATQADHPIFQLSFKQSVQGVELEQPLPVASWVYVVNTFDTTAELLQFFTDGKVQVSASTNGLGSMNISDNPLSFGRAVPGAMDEIRLSAGARTPEYVALQHLSMTDHALEFGVAERVD